MSLLVARRGLLAAGAAPTEEPPPSGDYAAEVAADGPIGWWRLAETSGSTAADEVGTNDLTVFGPNLDVQGPTGNGALFDGVDDSMRLVGDSINITTALTLEALIRTPIGDLHDLIHGQYATGQSTPNRGYAMLVGADGSLQLWSSPSGESFQSTMVSTAGAVPANEWCHISVTWSTSEPPKGYVNGVEVGYETQVNDSRSLDGSGRDYTIGVRGSSGNNYDENWYEGDVAEAAVYDKVLSAARIAAHASAAGLGS